MDKTTLLAKVRAAQKALDELRGMVLAMEDAPPPPPPILQQARHVEPWVSAKQLQQHFNISESTFYRWIDEGLLPPGEPWGPKSKRWKLSEIEAWRTQCREEGGNDFKGKACPKTRKTAVAAAWGF